MKSTIYQHHLRASASFSYRHFIALKTRRPLTGPVALAAGLCGPDGPSWPVSGAFPALPHRRGRCGQFRDKSAEAGRRSPDVDT